MSKNTTDKLVFKRDAFARRTALALGITEAQAIKALSVDRMQSIRINPLKADDQVIDCLRELGWSGEKVEWVEGGYTISDGLAAVRDSRLVAEGQVYIQNAASWLPVLALDPRPGDEILDVCAAPGGKTSHIAAMANNQAKITANDNSRPRLLKLQANLERLGVKNVEYTLFDAAQLARKLEDRKFDKILLDAPCSGEGMMNYQRDKDFATWSVAHIKRLQQLQKRLITQAWQLLKPGGTLVYSTCTMAPEENEAVIDYLLRKAEDVQLIPFNPGVPNAVKPVREWNSKVYDPRVASSLRLAPSQNIEAFYVSKLQKILHPNHSMLYLRTC